MSEAPPPGNEERDDSLEPKIFHIFKNDILYDIELSKTKKKKPYLTLRGIEAINNPNQFYVLTKTFDEILKISNTFYICENLDDAYNTFLDYFKNKRVSVKEINNRQMKLEINAKDLNEKEEIIELILVADYSSLNGSMNSIKSDINNQSDMLTDFKKKFDFLFSKIKILEENEEKYKRRIDDLSKNKEKLEKNMISLNEKIRDIQKENILLKNEINIIKSKVIIKNDGNTKNDLINNDLDLSLDIGGIRDLGLEGGRLSSVTVGRGSYTKRNSNSIGINEGNYYFISDPLKLSFNKNLTESANFPSKINNTFTIFSPIGNCVYLVFGTKYNSIDCYDVNSQKRIFSISNAHNKKITSIKHFFDQINRKYLIISTSYIEKIVKIWDVETTKLIVSVCSCKDDSFSFLTSACVFSSLKDNKNYIITSTDSEYESLKIWDFKGREFKTLNDSNDINYSVDIFFDKFKKKNYIITCNAKNIKSFYFRKYQIHNVFCESNSNNNSKEIHYSYEMFYDKEETKLLDSDSLGIIRIWEFHSAKLLTKINETKGIELISVCLWNEKYLLVAADKNIKLIDLNNKTVVKSLESHLKSVYTLKKIILPSFGECFVSGGADEQIKLWTVQNNII